MAQNYNLRSFPTMDRLSDLPPHVVENILTRMPLRSAVKTSTLSRDWRYKWVTVPYLVFDNNFHDPFNGNHPIESIIDQTLVSHRGAITGFSQLISNGKCNAAINRWLFFLSNHPIEHLALTFSGSHGRCITPAQVFTFQHLAHLHVARCEVKLPSTFIEFSNLVRLEFISVHIEVGVLKMLLSKCPVLESLSLMSCNGISCLHVDAPSLKDFQYVGQFSSIEFQNVNLENISICGEERGPNAFEFPVSQGSDSNLTKVLSRLLLVKNLKLSSSVMQYFANGGVPEKLPNNLNHLAMLDLNSIKLGCMKEVQCSLCLLRSSPNLQTLILTLARVVHNGVENSVQYLKQQQELNVSLSCLKHVKIKHIFGSEYEIEFVKLLLQWATELEKLEIRSVYFGRKDIGGYKLLRELSSFRRASSKAVLIFD